MKRRGFLSSRCQVTDVRILERGSRQGPGVLSLTGLQAWKVSRLQIVQRATVAQPRKLVCHCVYSAPLRRQGSPGPTYLARAPLGSDVDYLGST